MSGAPRPTPKINAKVAGGAAGAVLALTLAANLIRPWEQEVQVPYRDVVGVLTVCYGHTGPDIQNRRYSHAECEALLERDIRAHAVPLASCMTRAAPPEVFGAMTSLAFNIGPRAVCRSSAVRYINQGNWSAACEAMGRWNTAGGRVIRGLQNRRRAEQAVCRRAGA